MFETKQYFLYLTMKKIQSASHDCTKLNSPFYTKEINLATAKIKITLPVFNFMTLLDFPTLL
jgi:hypothetical protein